MLIKHKEGRNGTEAQWHSGSVVCNSPFEGVSREAGGGGGFFIKLSIF